MVYIFPNIIRLSINLIKTGFQELNKVIDIKCTIGPLGKGVINAFGMAEQCKAKSYLYITTRMIKIDNNAICQLGNVYLNYFCLNRRLFNC